MAKSIRRYEFSGCSADIGFAEFVGCGEADEWNVEAVAISPLMCVVSSDTSMPMSDMFMSISTTP